MSSSASQPVPEVKPVQPIPRTRLQPIGGAGKSVYVVAVCLTLSIVGALTSRAYSKGGTAFIASNAPAANIQVDVSFRIASAAGSVEFPGLPFGTRSLQIRDRDHEALSTIIPLGWLSSNHFSFQLTPIPLTLMINTVPGAEVLLNGQSAGVSNNQGVFVKAGVMPGDYDIQVTLAGHSPFHQKRHLSPKLERVFAWLNVSQERMQQMQEEQRHNQENAIKVQQLLGSARQQFNSRQYKAALASVDQALRIDPANSGAQQLKNQIVQTMNILR